MTVELVLPTQLVHADGISGGLVENLLVTELPYGPRKARTYEERPREIFEFELVDLRSATPTDYQRFRRFLQQCRNSLGVFWVLGQLDEVHDDLSCGPLGDGSTTCFPVPIFGLDTGTLEVVLAGFPQELTTDYVLRDVANLFDADFAACEDVLTAIGENNCTVSQVSVVSPSGLYCFKVTPSSAALSAYTVATVAVDANKVYTGVASFLGNDTYKVRIDWFDSVPSLISTSTSTGISGSTTGWTQESVSATAPGTAVTARLTIIQQDSTDSIWFAGAHGLIPGDFARWYHPDAAPYVIEFTSAPSDGQRVIASGEGYRLYRGFAQKMIGFERELEGDTLVPIISMVEDVEQ